MVFYGFLWVFQWIIQDFNRIDSIRASQKKRRADDIRNKELSANQNLYQLSKNPPTVGLENAGFEVCSKISENFKSRLQRQAPYFVLEIGFEYFLNTKYGA